eukprot:PhM_4_TR1154/c0_g2_i1/m.3435
MALTRRVISGHERGTPRPITLTTIHKNSPTRRNVRDLTRRDAAPRRMEKRDEVVDPVDVCAHSAESFNELLRQLPKQSKSTVVRVMEKMRSLRIPMDHVTYNLMISKVVDVADDTAMLIYREMWEESQREDSSVRPDLTTFSLLIHGCGRTGDFERAFALYKEMKELVIFPDVDLYNTLIGFCVATRNEEKATGILDEMKQRGVAANVHTYNSLMSVFTDATCELIYQLFEDMVKQRIAPNRRTYNTLIRTCQRVDDYEKAFEYYDEMKRENITPDVVTYNILIEMCRERLDHYDSAQAIASSKRTKEQREMGIRAIADLSLSLFAEMEEQAVQPNTFTYNSLMGVLSRCKDVKVFDVFEDMKADAAAHNPLSMVPAEVTDRAVPSWIVETEDLTLENLEMQPALFEDPIADQGRINCRGVRCDMLSYMTVIQAAERLGMVDRAFALFEELKDEAGIVPDTSVFVVMMDVCVMGKDKRRAFQLYEEARSQGNTPDIKLCNALMNVLAELGDDQVFEVFEDIRSGRVGHNVRPTQDTYNILMKACVQSKHPDRALGIYRDMTSKSCLVKPDTITYNILMDVCALNKDIDTVRSLVLDMRRRDVPATITTYNKMMNVFVEAEDAGIVEIFEDIRRNGPPPNLTTFAILLGFYLKKQDEAIIYLFEDIRTSGVEPDLHVYNIMINYCALVHDKRKAGKYFEELKNRGLHPDIETYNAMMAVLAESGEETILFVFKEMMEKGINPTPKTFSILGKHKKGLETLRKAGNRRLLQMK